MASGSAPRGLSAQWNKDETAALLVYLEEHKSEIGDGGMFKMGTFNAAAAKIAKYHDLGPVKTGDKCKTKWWSVHILFIYILCASLIVDQSSAQNNLQLYSKLPRKEIGFALG
jgi:hypothetical protein